MKVIIKKFLLIVMLVVGGFSALGFYNTENQQYVENLHFDKIIFEGYDLNMNSNLDNISDEIYSDDYDTVKIQLVLDYDYLPQKKYIESIHGDNVDDFIRNQRNISKEYHTVMNNLLIESLGFYDYNDIYVSSYSPFINLEFDEEIFLDNYLEYTNLILANDNIQQAYIQKEKDDYETNFNTALTAGNVKSTVDTGTYTGKGVVVGVLESGGIMDKNHVNISGSNYTIRNEWYYNETVSDHATKVASIIGGNYGIAKGAHILSVELAGDAVSEVDWMLDRDVNIINMSYGDATPTGKYSSKSAYMDYISRNQWVTFVGAAGNEGGDTDYVINPGLGYNVLTVGATNMTGSTLASYSSFKVDTGPHKPSIVAPSGFIIPNYSSSSSGTSFSTPYVSGSIALLMEMFPTLKSYPEHVVSILTSSAKSMSAHPDRLVSGLNNKVGAGLIDFEKAIVAYNNKKTITNTSGTQSTYLNTTQVYLTAGTKIKASLFWMLNSNNSTTIEMTDYDLRFLNSSGTILKSASSSGNNLEMIEYTVTSTGYYSLSVYQYSAKKTTMTDWLSLSYTVN